MEAEQKNGNKNRTKAVLIISVMVFAIGFGLGFYIFGYHKRSSTDYKQSLREVIEYIDTLEKERNDLAARLKSLETRQGPLPGGAPVDAAPTTSLQERVDALERENASLRSSMTQNQALLQENYQLRGRLQALEERMGPPAGSSALQQGQPAPTQTIPPSR